MRFIRKHRANKKEYFFGFGADREDVMLEAIIGHTPKVIGTAILPGYALCIQKLSDIPETGNNPREILRNAWGDTFVSYCIDKQQGAAVHGTLFEVTVKERVMIDIWELVYDGWQRSAIVTVKLPDGRRVRARTQLLRRGQSHGKIVDDHVYHSWLLPVGDFVRIANEDSRRYPRLLAELGY